MKPLFIYLFVWLLPVIFISCSAEAPQKEPDEQKVIVEQKLTDALVFRYDSDQRLKEALKEQKVDLVSRGECSKLFNGCCLPEGINSYYFGVNSDLFNITSPYKRDIGCEMWFHYKSDGGQVLAFPVDYSSKRNMFNTYGIYFECITEGNKFWVPNLNYYHKGWPSETFDYVMDFSPSKFIRFNQQFCKGLAVPSPIKTATNKLFPLYISENLDYKVYSEKAFSDIELEYKDISTGMDNFADYYYFDRLDYIRDRLANFTMLVRDNETHYPIEGAIVTITPIEGAPLGVEAFERFSDFALRAPNFDYGFYGFKNCANAATLDKFSMQSKLFTYFTEYGVNPWAIIRDELVTKTNRDGEIYWTTNNLLKSNSDLYANLIETPIFKKEVFAKGFFYAVEKYKKYRISIVHPKYQYFEGEFNLKKDSQILIELAQTTTKFEQVKGKGNYERMIIREIKLK